MTIGMLLYIIAAIILFLGAISTVIPAAITWGLFCIALGLALDDFSFGAFRRR
jgi:hypothetical protein